MEEGEEEEMVVVPEFAVDEVLEEFHLLNNALFLSLPEKQAPLPWDSSAAAAAALMDPSTAIDDGSFLSNPMVAMMVAGRLAVERLDACDISVLTMQVSIYRRIVCYTTALSDD